MMRRFWSWLADLADQLEELLVDWLDDVAESARRRSEGPCLSWFDTDACELWAGHTGNHRGGLRIWMDAIPMSEELLEDIRLGSDLGTGVDLSAVFPQFEIHNPETGIPMTEVDGDTVTGDGDGDPLPELLDDIRFGDVDLNAEPDLSQFLTPPSQNGWPESRPPHSGDPEFE